MWFYHLAQTFQRNLQTQLNTHILPKRHCVYFSLVNITAKVMTFSLYLTSLTLHKMTLYSKSRHQFPVVLNDTLYPTHHLYVYHCMSLLLIIVCMYVCACITLNNLVICVYVCISSVCVYTSSKPLVPHPYPPPPHSQPTSIIAFTDTFYDD